MSEDKTKPADGTDGTGGDTILTGNSPEKQEPTTVVKVEGNTLPSIPKNSYNKPSQKQRMLQIRRMFFIQKLEIEEIAEALDISTKTVRRVLYHIKKQSKTMIQQDIESKRDMLDFLWEMQGNYKERIRKLWNGYKKCNEEIEKMEILREIRQQEKQHFDMLQSVGILPKDAQAQIGGVTYVSKLRDDEKESGNKTVIKPLEEQVKENDNILKQEIPVKH